MEKFKGKNFCTGCPICNDMEVILQNFLIFSLWDILHFKRITFFLIFIIVFSEAIGKWKAGIEDDSNFEFNSGMEDKISFGKPKTSFKVVTVLQPPFMMWDEESGTKYNNGIKRYSEIMYTFAFVHKYSGYHFIFNIFNISLK